MKLKFQFSLVLYYVNIFLQNFLFAILVSNYLLFLCAPQEASNPPKGGVQSSGGHHLRDNNGTKKLGQGGGSAAALNWLSSRCTVL